MDQTKPFNIFPFYGDDLVRMQEYVQLWDEFNAKHSTIRQQAKQDLEMLTAEYNEKLWQIWDLLAEKAGVDTEAAWASKDYWLETRYLDLGFGALVYPAQENDGAVASPSSLSVN